MAVFFINVCKFQNCGIVFPTMNNLIEHIEEVHIDFERKLFEDRISPYDVLPLSRILKYSNCRRVQNTPVLNMNIKNGYYTQAHAVPNGKVGKMKFPKGDDMVAVDPHRTVFNNCSTSYSSNSSLSSGPESPNVDFPEKPEKSNYTFKKSIMDPNNYKNNDNLIPKRYECEILGCNKTYKHANGIRYHRKFGHCSFDKAKRNRKNKKMDCKNFNKLNLKQFISLCPPSELSEMEVRNRNISEHGYSSPYVGCPTFPSYMVKNKVPYYV